MEGLGDWLSKACQSAECATASIFSQQISKRQPRVTLEPRICHAMALPFFGNDDGFQEVMPCKDTLSLRLSVQVATLIWTL